PVHELAADRLGADGIAGREVGQRLVRQHHAPAERVVGPVALDHDDRMGRIAPLHEKREVQSGRPAAQTRNAHAARLHLPGSRRWLAGVGILAASVVAAGAAQAQELKIGIMAVLSGPQAVLGGQLRDGFMLGIKHAGGKLGGLATTVTVQDDELKPDVAVGKAKQLIERDKVDFVVGPVFSNILMAIHKPITEAQVFLISPNAGPSPLAGQGCSPFFFVTSYQNDQAPEVPGKPAQGTGFKNAFLLAPNYQAGKDM